MTKEKFNMKKFKEGEITLKVEIPIPLTIELSYHSGGLPICMRKIAGMNEETYRAYNSPIGWHIESTLNEIINVEGVVITEIEKEAKDDTGETI